MYSGNFQQSITAFIKDAYYLELFLFLFVERASSLPAEERKDYAEKVSCFHYMCVSGTLYTIPSANSSPANASQFLTSELNLCLYCYFPIMSCSKLLIIFFFSSFNCQQVAIAFWRAMGGSEDEIAGLGEDSDS